MASNVEQGLQLSSDLTGIDVRELLGRLAGAAPAAPAASGTAASDGA